LVLSRLSSSEFGFISQLAGLGTIGRIIVGGERKSHGTKIGNGAKMKTIRFKL
jgi:hypothetical protein